MKIVAFGVGVLLFLYFLYSLNSPLVGDFGYLIIFAVALLVSIVIIYWMVEKGVLEWIMTGRKP